VTDLPRLYKNGFKGCIFKFRVEMKVSIPCKKRFAVFPSSAGMSQPLLSRIIKLRE
jgi:hypothetical protein